MTGKMPSSEVVLGIVLCWFFSAALAKSVPGQDAPRNLVKREAQNSSDSGICQKPIDLVLALDSSESVGAENWMKMINATIKFVNQFDVRYTRFGLIQFHSSPEVPIVLSSFPDNKTLSETIAKVYYKAGSTRTDLAAMKVVEVFKAASHRKASKVAVFILGGLSTDVYVSQGASICANDLLKEPAQKLNQDGIAVLAAGVQEKIEGDDRNKYKKEMDTLVSEPPPEHIVEVKSFDELLESKAEDLAKKSCVVNGVWGSWSEWSTCSVTCGGGTQLHMRVCNNPKPENGGLPCAGAMVEQQSCNMQPCGDDGFPIALKPHPSTSPNVSSNASNNNALSNVSSNGTLAIFPEPLPSNGSSNAIALAMQTTPTPAPTPAPAPVGTTAAPQQAQGPGSTVTYGTPDPYTCGNKFEKVQLMPSQLSASSVYTRDTQDMSIFNNHEPANGLLNNVQRAGAWCAEHRYAMSNDRTQFLAVDLGEATLIGKVATQGMHRYPNWVKSFTINYSFDARQWSSYRTALRGNTDQDTIVENILNPPIHARFIRFIPQTWNTRAGPGKNDICMRIGLYKCRACYLVPITRCLARHSKDEPDSLSKRSKVTKPTETHDSHKAHTTMTSDKKGH